MCGIAIFSFRNIFAPIIGEVFTCWTLTSSKRAAGLVMDRAMHQVPFDRHTTASFRIMVMIVGWSKDNTFALNSRNDRTLSSLGPRSCSRLLNMISLSGWEQQPWNEYQMVAHYPWRPRLLVQLEQWPSIWIRMMWVLPWIYSVHCAVGTVCLWTEVIVLNTPTSWCIIKRKSHQSIAQLKEAITLLNPLAPQCQTIHTQLTHDPRQTFGKE